MRAQIQARLRNLRISSVPLHSMQPEGGAEPSEELRQRLAGPHARAAVLIGLIERHAGINVLLTRRAEHLPRHAGQVAFPGGRIEPQDADEAAAALREAHEEIGLSPGQVELVGRLGDHITGTGFIVTPVVGFVAPEFVPAADPAEVASVFEVPLGDVFDPGLLRSCVLERYGTRLRGYELIHDGERIWGATAAMLASFRNIVYETIG
jgi:8-oxo-dGTP pyrophosphatase MutT (NUDIX family)